MTAYGFDFIFACQLYDYGELLVEYLIAQQKFLIGFYCFVMYFLDVEIKRWLLVLVHFQCGLSFWCSCAAYRGLLSFNLERAQGPGYALRSNLEILCTLVWGLSDRA